jgi:hypothetical protein
LFECWGIGETFLVLVIIGEMFWVSKDFSKFLSGKSSIGYEFGG